MGKKQKVFVGLSGGVDSSVSAWLLKEQGYEVVGVFIKTWQPDFIECNWEAERLDAMRVAAHLRIPFLTFDAEEAYKTQVGDYMIAEYKRGRTPNPDVMCNTHVKFGAFLPWALTQGADFVATGHYAQRTHDADGYHLLRGVDRGKDQSYFLWTLTQKELAHILFPVGHLQKAEVRVLAEKAKLPVFAKKDSQGICFLGPVDMEEFLGHYAKLEKGDVLNEQGEKIGTHKGALIYTIGQRHGFTVQTHGEHQGALYVVSKDMDANTVTVGKEAPTLMASDTLTLEDISRIRALPEDGLMAQFRYRQTPFVIHMQEDTQGRGILSVSTETERPSIGQSCVFYKGNECFGGGILCS